MKPSKANQTFPDIPINRDGRTSQRVGEARYGRNTAAVIMIIFALVAIWPTLVKACPFCSPFIGSSLLMEIDSAETVVLATLAEPPTTSDDRTAEFFVVDVIKGGDRVERLSPLEVNMTGINKIGSRYLLIQIPDQKAWVRHIVSPKIWQFAREAVTIPETRENISDAEQSRRLVFCLPYLVSENERLARSAYGEFAAAPYSAINHLASQLDGEQLKSWIKSTGEDDSRLRGLLFTLLGACGDENDEEFLRVAFEHGLNKARSTELATIIAAWIKISGADALEQIDRRLLVPEKVESTRRRAAVEALRFFANVDRSGIEKTRVIESARHLLVHPDAADFIIRDLAEWEDWESLETILALWNQHGRTSAWLRPPIVDYLKACPNGNSQKALALIVNR